MVATLVIHAITSTITHLPTLRVGMLSWPGRQTHSGHHRVVTCRP